MRVAALTAMRALQRLLAAVVLPRAALAVRPLASRLAMLMPLAVPLAPVTRLGAVAVLAMPVRSAVAAAGVRGRLRMALITTVGMLALLAAVRVAPA